MAPKIDPNEVKIIYLRATGGEVGASSALAPNIGPLGLAPTMFYEPTADAEKLLTIIPVELLPLLWGNITDTAHHSHPVHPAPIWDAQLEALYQSMHPSTWPVLLDQCWSDRTKLNPLESGLVSMVTELWAGSIPRNRMRVEKVLLLLYSRNAFVAAEQQASGLSEDEVLAQLDVVERGVKAAPKHSLWPFPGPPPPLPMHRERNS
ncbi:60S ribosomal protein L12 [Pseudohyphozyma bogoriensis]|nr:60S ribosomal protein L12 [Pseudohyphozyma bogoriensis]